MAFLSVPCVMALYSVQWSPVFLAALFLPWLLPVAVVKPQLGVALLAAGRWNKWSVLVSASIVCLSVALRPSWAIEWAQRGVANLYDSRMPLLIGPGALLAAAAALVSSSPGRLLLAMALIPQQFYYDQLLLFFVPASWRQMLALLTVSWAGAGWCLHTGVWIPSSGYQIDTVWITVIWTLFIPALTLLFLEWWMQRPPEPADTTPPQREGRSTRGRSITCAWPSCGRARKVPQRVSTCAGKRRNPTPPPFRGVSKPG